MCTDEGHQQIIVCVMVHVCIHASHNHNSVVCVGGQASQIHGHMVINMTVTMVTQIVIFWDRMIVFSVRPRVSRKIRDTLPICFESVT